MPQQCVDPSGQPRKLKTKDRLAQLEQALRDHNDWQQRRQYEEAQQREYNSLYERMGILNKRADDLDKENHRLRETLTALRQILAQ